MRTFLICMDGPFARGCVGAPRAGTCISPSRLLAATSAVGDSVSGAVADVNHATTTTPRNNTAKIKLEHIRSRKGLILCSGFVDVALFFQ